jgi:hypothetical protein
MHWLMNAVAGTTDMIENFVVKNPGTAVIGIDIYEQKRA